MTLKEFDQLAGHGSYVRCVGKIRKGKDILDYDAANKRVSHSGQIGWWVAPGYIVVDIDEGKEAALKVVKALGLKTLMCKTPKGLHLYFKTDKTFPQKIGMVLPCGLKCDFRCAGKGYVLLPWHSEGRTFNKRKRVAELPLEFTPMVGRKESLYDLAEGDGRNTALFNHLMAYKNRGASDDDVWRMAKAINDCVFNQPMEFDELRKLVTSTEQYEPDTDGFNPYVLYNKDGRPTQINHRAVCDFFVNRGDTFVHGGECYVYTDGVYREASSAVRNEIKSIIEYDNLVNQARIMECFRLILDDVRLQKGIDDINANKALINFRNGVWDIESQQLTPHQQEYLQTIQLNHDVGPYKPIEKTKLYKFFEVCSLSRQDIDMILAYMAYCMTLRQDLKTFMILVGQSNTGKSVLIRFITALVGVQNTCALSMHELNMRFYPAQLYNRLLNACGDSSSLPLSSIENLKKITGGDQIMHERKGKEPFFFVPFAKLLFSFNQLPLQLEEKSNAFYKRMRILHMNKELFLNNEYVTDLCSPESVAEVIPYLLTLLPLEEIPRTRTSNRYVEALRKDSDSIHAFIASKCSQGETKDAHVSKTELYNEYVEYCAKYGREYHKKHGFTRIIRALGYNERRIGKYKEPCWQGLYLKSGKGRVI